METTDGTPNPERIEGKVQAWGEVTNPREHNPAKFRYLVHAINPFASSTMPMMALQVQMDRASDINREDGDQSINMFRQPERLGERIALSCSLIDQEHHGTWGKAGLIVEAPAENVVITQSSDAGALVMSKKLLEEQARRNHLFTAEQLLAQTSPMSYNEVVTLANKEGKKVQLAGFFYKVTDDGEAMEEGLARQMRIHAERLNLPIVAITEPNPYGENKVIRTDESLSAHFNGKYFNLRGSDVWRFRTLDQKGLSSFINPDEIDGVLSFMQEQGLSEDEVRQLREEYTKADEERQKPKLKLDEQGEVQSIEKRTGYGTSERVMRIGKTGYTSWANVMEEGRKIAEMMADPMRPQMARMGPEPMLNPHEVESIVQELLVDASDAEREKIETWYQSIRDNVSQNWQRNQERAGYFGSKLTSFDSYGDIKPKLDFDFGSLLKGFSGKKFEIKPPQQDTDETDTKK